MGRLQDKVIVVTGGASGLGQAMATRFVREGARVLVADVQAGGQSVAAALNEEAPGCAAFRVVDVTDEDDCAGAVAEAIERWGRLDTMVANAGIGGHGGPIADLSKESFEQVLAVNLTGVFLCAKHAFRAMRESGGGVILATASKAGLRGAPGLGGYGPAKAGVIQLIKTLALEGAPANIRANALCPIWVRTPMVESYIAGIERPPEQVAARLIAHIPLGRMGTPEDVAAAAVYLCSDEAAFLTGLALPIDGGSIA